MANKNDKIHEDDMDIDDNSDNSIKKDGDSVDNTPETGESKENRTYLDEIPDGAGCTEIWEHLSQGRDE